MKGEMETMCHQPTDLGVKMPRLFFQLTHVNSEQVGASQQILTGPPPPGLASPPGRGKGRLEPGISLCDLAHGANVLGSTHPPAPSTSSLEWRYNKHHI